MPLPEAYVALRSIRPVSSMSLSIGGSATSTGSLNVTLTWIVSPGPYVPLAFGDETNTALGRQPSTSREPAPGGSRPSAPGSGSVRFAAAPSDRADIEPPLRARADGDV